MTEAEVRFASEELRQVVQTCPTGSWQIRAIAKILLQMIATGVPTIMEAPKVTPYDDRRGDVPSARTLRARK